MYVLELEVTKRAATPSSSEQDCVLLYCLHFCLQTPQLAHHVIGVNGWSLTRDHHAGNGPDVAVSSPADALEAGRMKSGRLGIKSPSKRMASIEKGGIRNHVFTRPYSRLNLHSFHVTCLPESRQHTTC